MLTCNKTWFTCESGLVSHTHSTILITLFHGNDPGTFSSVVVVRTGGGGVIRAVHSVQTGSPVLQVRQRENMSVAMWQISTHYVSREVWMAHQ